MPENPSEHAPTRRLRQGLSSTSGGLVSLATVASTILALIALPRSDNLVKLVVGIAMGGFLLLTLSAVFVPIAVPRLDREGHRKRELARLARRIKRGPPGVLQSLPRKVQDRGRLVDDLGDTLRTDERVCVVELSGEDALGMPPGIPDGMVPKSIQCQVIVGAIGWQLENALVLGETGKDVAADLRAVASFTLRSSDPMATLRREVVRVLERYRLAGSWRRLQLVPLAAVWRESLNRPAGQWLLGLLEDLRCTYGIFTEEPDHPAQSHGVLERRLDRYTARSYVRWMLSRRLTEAQVSTVFAPLYKAADHDLDLIKVRCAVIAVAAEFDEEAEPLSRLADPGSAGPMPPAARERAAALEFRWLVGRKAARIAHADRDLTGAFDRLAVIGLVTPEMFGELMRGLGLSAAGVEEFRLWLGSEEFAFAGIIESPEGGIRLGKMIRDAAVEWLSTNQPSAHQDAQIAAERCFRVCLVLNRENIPAPGYADLAAPGYGGLHLYEIPDWWKNVHVWRGYVAEISSPENVKDAGIAIICLFFETWWWWGDQLRLRYVDDVLDIAREILRGQPEWIGALEEFDQNYVPELDQRASAGDKWRHVANALGVISSGLGLSQGDVPGDPVLARIYICWCFFNGDVAQQTGDLDAADRWFRLAAQACGDDEDNAGMRAFACYQQADVWVQADGERSMKVISETGLVGAADELDDLSLRAYLARMYGDIRWNSGDIDGAFDAYGRALLQTYVYQVDQESDTMPPSEYSYALYKEMRTRLSRCSDEARREHHENEAKAAVNRIRTLFAPYWEHVGAAGAPSEQDLAQDPLADVVPPLPDLAVLNTFNSDYARDALLMLHDELREEIAVPVDRPLPPG